MLVIVLLITHFYISSFSIYGLSPFQVPGTVLGIKDTNVNKIRSLVLGRELTD